ncbi:MAG: cation transporter [Candidatus Marinimicrobia bacterium]|nr:cation transporter [Candidatus Neomarinimicrobiota bacterium]MBT5356315.1 cation transporter [Candidatus Neomarinimicrobiota bacterium]MBT6913970.1 cation transporter [Candidatus Neomarinimicrobiota bacterium]
MPNHVFIVKDMTCQGCAGKIRSALEAHDYILNFKIDVEKKLVSASSDSDWHFIANLIREAGYTPESIKKKKGLFEKLFG